jgi:hypothetical protein
MSQTNVPDKVILSPYSGENVPEDVKMSQTRQVESRKTLWNLFCPEKRSVGEDEKNAVIWRFRKILLFLQS